MLLRQADTHIHRILLLKKAIALWEGPMGWARTPVALPSLSSLKRWKDQVESGRAKVGAFKRAFWSREKWMRGPLGVSLAAWYSGLAVIAKLEIHCLRNPTKNETWKNLICRSW